MTTSQESMSEPPDEATLLLPARLRSLLIPRRGGAAGPELTVDATVVDTSVEWLTSMRDDIEAALSHKDSELDLVAAARTYLERGVEKADPTGAAAAVVAAVASGGLDRVWPAEKCRALANAWVRARGVVFAATAVVEAAGLVIGGQERYDPRHWSVRRDQWDDTLYRDAPCLALCAVWVPLVWRIRAHLAATSDDEYAESCAALARLREGTPLQRAATSCLLPTQTTWVDDDCRELVTILGDEPVSYEDTRIVAMAQLLWCAASTAEHVTTIVAHARPRWFLSEPYLVTAADGARSALVPILLDWLGQCDVAIQQRLLTVMSVIPDDEAFRGLVRLLATRDVSHVVAMATRRYPVRAVRLLAEAAGGRSVAASTAANLLRIHVLSNATAVDAALPTLDPASQRRITAIRERSAPITEASADRLPAVLVSPAWTTKHRRAKPTVLTGLIRPNVAEVVWRPGEREEYLPSSRDWTPPTGFASGQELAEWCREHPDHTFHDFYTHGPEDLARPLVAHWRPRWHYYPRALLRSIVARFELDALPLALHLAKSEPATKGVLLLPYASNEVADLMADWLVRLSSARPVARAWLARHPEAAARALIPAALGEPGAARRTAERALRTVAATGHHAAVRAAAATYGPTVVEAVERMLTADPMDMLPAKAPTLPDWLEPEVLPWVLLRDRTRILPPAAVRHLCTLLAMSTKGEAYAALDVVKEACDPRSLAELGWALFQQWQAAGANAKQAWVLESLGWIGDDETARRLTPLICAWPGEGAHARAVAGLDVLATIGTDTALMQLYGISRKVKFKALRDSATRKIDQVAENRRLTAEELADRLVPDFDLDASGSMVLDYGPRQFTVGFDEELKPYVIGSDGKTRKTLPKPGVRDDQERAAAEYKRFATLKRQVRTVAGNQIRRLEEAMVTQRRWKVADFRRLLVGHPLVWHIVRRLVWATFDGDTVRTAFRVAEDRTFADVDDDTIALDDDAVVGVPHPLHLGDAIPAWSELFADYEILQPFPQLAREVYRFTEEERAAKTLTRFRGATSTTAALVGLERRGWRRGEPLVADLQVWLTRAVPSGKTVAVGIDPGIHVATIDGSVQKLVDVWVDDRPIDGWRSDGALTFDVLDPVTASEIIRDLTEVTA